MKRRELSQWSLVVVLMSTAVANVPVPYARGGEGGNDPPSQVEWRPGSGVTGQIYKSIDAQWFHISETCTLRAKGTDVDQKKVGDGPWQDDSGNYINLPQTVWSGPGLTESTGADCPWTRATPTGVGGSTVTATLKDLTTSPNTAADDPDGTATRQMYAYEALTYLNCTPGDLPSVSIYETVGAGATGKKASGAFLYDSKTVTASNADEKTGEINKGLNATWILQVNPNGASLSTNGQLKVAIGVKADGYLHGEVFDDDWYDGTVTITAGISASYKGVGGISLSTPFTFGSDEAEAIIGMGFGFDSKDLGTTTLSTLAMKSADYGDDTWFDVYDSHGTEDVRFGHSNTATIRGPINTTSAAVASAQGHARAKTRDPDDDAKAIMTIGEVPDPDRPGVNMPAYVNYNVCVPTYEPGTPPGPEAGY